MAFLTVNKEDVKKEGGSGYINKSGIYNLTLKHAQVKETANGATQINYLFDKAMSYGNTILGVNGQPTFGFRVLEGLATIQGLDTLEDPEATEVKFKKGTQELMCLPDLNDIEVKAWIKVSYGMYNGDIKERVEVKRFYRVKDDASGSEILLQEEGNEVSIGDRLGKDSEVASVITYEDGATEESVATWKKAQQSGGGSIPPQKPAAGGFPAPKKSGFPGAK